MRQQWLLLSWTPWRQEAGQSDLCILIPGALCEGTALVQGGHGEPRARTLSPLCDLGQLLPTLCLGFLICEMRLDESVPVAWKSSAVMLSDSEFHLGGSLILEGAGTMSVLGQNHSDPGAKRNKEVRECFSFNLRFSENWEGNGVQGGDSPNCYLLGREEWL